VTLIDLSARGGNTFMQAAIQACRVLNAALHEIFDESAYERFLTRTDVARSKASYRLFLREKEASLASKPRCC